VREKVLEVASKENAVSFDMPSAKLHYREGKCAFEVILEKYGMKDPALECMVKIVCGVDIPEDINITLESAGLRPIAHGFHYLVDYDYRKMELEFPICDALYEYRKKKVMDKE